MRELRVDETVIFKFWELDCSDFNEERRYQEHQADFPDYNLLSPVELDDVKRILNVIENIKNDNICPNIDIFVPMCYN